MTDWPTIRAQYEQGISQRSLAVKYGISQAAISKHAKKETWVVSEVIIPQSAITDDNSEPVETSEQTTVEIVEKALRSLAQHLSEDNMDLKSHKLFADALSQYVKLKLLVAPADERPTASGLPAELLPYATLDELAALDSIVKAIEERKLQQEQEAAGIRPLKRG